MTPKLTDVARLAGVSPTTVSRVINNYGYIGEATRKKVYEAMETLNYQPNASARSLHGKQTTLIGVLLPSLADPFFGELIENIEKKLFQSGYKILLCGNADHQEKTREYVRTLAANQVDGAITATSAMNAEIFDKVSFPVLAFDCPLSDKVPLVSSDHYLGGVLAAQALYQAGARCICYLDGAVRAKSGQEDRRRAGFEETLKTFRLAARTVTLAFDQSAILKAMSVHQLLAQGDIDGIFCSDDLTALLVMQQSNKIGRPVPDPLKVIGYGGSSFIQTYHPELSTIVQPIDDLATLLVELLIIRMNNPETALKKQYTLPVRLLNSLSTSPFR